jgi:hypothetical protein
MYSSFNRLNMHSSFNWPQGPSAQCTYWEQLEFASGQVDRGLFVAMSERFSEEAWPRGCAAIVTRLAGRLP